MVSAYKFHPPIFDFEGKLVEELKLISLDVERCSKSAFSGTEEK